MNQKQNTKPLKNNILKHNIFAESKNKKRGQNNRLQRLKKRTLKKLDL